MKTLKNIALVAAGAILFASCSKNENSYIDEGKPASLKITIAGEEGSKTKSVNPEISFPEEHAIHEYTVFVINSNTNKIQAKQSFSSGLTNTVTGLTSGPKKIVVVANSINVGTMPTVGDDYSKLLIPDTKTFAISSQIYQENLSTYGLAMSGETNIILNAGDNVMPQSLKIKRVVAKVRLGKLTYAPAAGLDGSFRVERVAIMKAKRFSTYGPGIVTTYSPWMGGIAGVVSNLLNSRFGENITLEDNEGRYFYVFPNDNTDGNATLLTVMGFYNDERFYYVARINDAVTGNGRFIERNGLYTINMTIKHPTAGSPDPETPTDPATLDLTVEVEPWSGEIIQNVEL